MLDQRLPILTIDRWNDYRKPRRYHTIERFDHIKNTLKKVDKKIFVQTKDRPKLNTEKCVRLAERMTKLLNIQEKPDDKAVSLQISWKNGAILYEDNKMTDYSLARYLEMKISSELVRIDQITGIDTKLDKKNLMFQIQTTGVKDGKPQSSET